MTNFVELITNLSTNMVILKAMLIPTNTPAFQQYALQATESNAQIIAQSLALDQRFMSTNRVACDFHSDVDGINGWIVFEDRYKFEYAHGAFHMFCDKGYSEESVPGENKAVVARWLRMTNVFAGPTGIARARTVASDAMSRISAPDWRLQPKGPPLFNLANGAPPSFQEIYRVDGILTPVPLYVFQWLDRSGALASIEVSGITSNVTLLSLPPYILLNRPANYYQLLGIPATSVFVTPWIKPGVYSLLKPATNFPPQ